MADTFRSRGCRVFAWVFVATIAALAWVVHPVLEANAPLEFRLGIPRALYESVEEADLEPLRTYLDAANIKTVARTVADAATLADRLLAGDLDIGIFTPVAYVRQNGRLPSLQPFMTHVINGMRYLQGYIVVRRDSGIEDLRGLQGKRFAYTSPDAFSGHLFPRYVLRKADLPTEGFFGQIQMTDDYMESLRMVYEQKVDGAAVIDEVLRLGDASDLPRKKFRVLAKSRRIPYIAYVARPDLPQEQIDRLIERLTGQRFKKLYLRVIHPEYRRSRTRSRKKASRDTRWNIDGFVTVTDRDFEEVRRMLAVVEGQGKQGPPEDVPP